MLAESGAMPAELNRILKTIRELDYKYEGEYSLIISRTFTTLQNQQILTRSLLRIVQSLQPRFKMISTYFSQRFPAKHRQKRFPLSAQKSKKIKHY
jgi:hypothetical protein